jgi:tetratricopeptide (TPR) repeat protein
MTIIAAAGLTAWIVQPLSAGQESTAAVFTDEPVGARPAAMAGAFAAVADDANTVYWNPAGLSQVQREELMFSHAQQLQGFRHEYLAFCLPWSLEDSLGLNAYVAYSDPFQRLDENGQDIGSFTEQNLYFSLAYSHAFNRYYSAGIALKGIGQLIDDYHGWTGAADFGVLASELIPDLRLGLVIRNLGKPLVLVAQNHPLNANVEFGAAYGLWHRRLLVTFDLQKPFFDEMAFKLGAEGILVEDVLYLRAGYRYFQYGNDLGPLSGLSLGVGFRIADYSVDYAYSPFTDLGDVHKLAVTLPFGRSIAEEKQLLAKLEQQVKDKQKMIFDSIVAEGDRWQDRGEYEKARQAYARAFGVNSLDENLNRKLKSIDETILKQQAAGHFKRGQNAFEGQDYLTALVELSKVLELTPDDASARNLLASANRKLSEEKLAQENNKNKQQMERYFQEGLDCLQHSRYVAALEMWNKILTLDPGNARVIQYVRLTKSKMEDLVADLLRLADQDWESDRCLEAVKKWRHVLDVNAGQAQALACLASHKSRLVEMADDYYRLGVQHYIQNNLSQAIGNWQNVLVMDPGNPKALRHLEYVQQKEKDLNSIK